MPHSRTRSQDSFASAASSGDQTFHPAPTTPTITPTPETSSRLSSSEEATLLKDSNSKKAIANAFFASRDFSSAIQTYDKALASLPDYLEYEVAILKANIAACHLKLEEWKEAVEAATVALDRLEILDPMPKFKEMDKIKLGVDGVEDAAARRRREAQEAEESEKALQSAAVVQEIDDETEAAYARLEASGHTFEEVNKLRIKALMRRAKARLQIGTWAELSGAEEDYKSLLRRCRGHLTGTDRTTVEKEARLLSPRLEEAKTREMGEMIGKLKDLGNGLLKPFGLSTDMFNFVKDEKEGGGYSMNINQGSKS